MKRLIEASLIVSLSIVCTALVLSLVLPNHPLAAQTPAAAQSVQLAVFIDGMDTRVVPVSGQDRCPFMGDAAASSNCPYLREVAASKACPFLAQRTFDERCPVIGGQGPSPSPDGTMPGDAMPPAACPRWIDLGPAVPDGGDLRLAPPSMASTTRVHEEVSLSS
jgi:hypothetical protein